jgi:hypothetical protein
VQRKDSSITGREHIRWFCSLCGSFLFWEVIKGDYYEIADGLPQNGQ